MPVCKCRHHRHLRQQMLKSLRFPHRTPVSDVFLSAVFYTLWRRSHAGTKCCPGYTGKQQEHTLAMGLSLTALCPLRFCPFHAYCRCCSGTCTTLDQEVVIEATARGNANAKCQLSNGALLLSQTAHRRCNRAFTMRKCPISTGARVASLATLHTVKFAGVVG